MSYWVEWCGGPEEAKKQSKGEALLSTPEPFLLPSMIEEIKREPTGRLAKDYRGVLRAALKNYFVPLSDLIRQHMNSLNLPSQDAFRESFPALAGDPQLRKILLVQMTNWATAMEHIVEREWDHEDFSNLFPPHHPFPVSILAYTITMMDRVKKQIEQMTGGETSFETISWEQERKHIRKRINDTAKGAESKYAVQ